MASAKNPRNNDDDLETAVERPGSASGLQPGGTSPGGGHAAGQGSLGTGGGSSAGAATGNVPRRGH